MAVLIFYSKPECSLCDKALAIARRVAADFDLKLTKVDIETDVALNERHRYRIPVLEVDGAEVGWGRIEEGDLRREVERIVGEPQS